jgi:uroporphyrinogen decarboxylase
MRYTSFERVKAALAHKEPDRIPFDIGGTMVTGINVNALRDLRKHLGLSGEVQIRDKVTQMADTGDEIIERLKIDIKNVSPEPPSKSGLANDLGLQGEHYRLFISQPAQRCADSQRY